MICTYVTIGGEKMDNYNRTHTGKRRTHTPHNTQHTARRHRFGSFLLACAGIFIFAVGINYLFPHFSKAVGDKVSEVVDYRAAFAVIGEGISGEKKLGEAFAEAWVVAFDGEEIPVMSNETASEPEASGNSELTDAIIAAFSESQRGYADYMTPGGVDYNLL